MSKYMQPQSDTLQLHGEDVPFTFRPPSAREALDVQMASVLPGQTLSHNYEVALPFVAAHLVDYDGEEVDVNDLPVLVVTGIASKMLTYRLMGKPRAQGVPSTPG